MLNKKKIIIPKLQLPFKNPQVGISNTINLRTAELIHPGIIGILKTMPGVPLANIQHYPSREAVLKGIATQLGIPSCKLILSAGSDLMISVLMEALGILTGRVILQHPTYPSWANYAALRKLDIQFIRFGEKRPYTFCLQTFILTLESSLPSLVVLTHPHSPTGFCFSTKELKLLSDACVKNGHMLLIDACYTGFTLPNFMPEIMADHVIFIKSFSKSFGIAGARVALTVASEEITTYLSHWRTDFSVTGQSLRVLEHMLNCSQQIQQICDDLMVIKSRFITEIQKLKPHWQPLPSGTNFVVFQLNSDSPSLICEYLLQHRIEIGNLDKISGLKGCVRITMASWDIMQRVLVLIKKYNELRNKVIL